MRREAGELSCQSASAHAGHSASADAGHSDPAGKCAGSHAHEEDEKGEEAQRQPAAPGPEDGTEAHLWSGSDRDRRNRCHDRADDCLRDRNGHEWISGREPFCVVAGLDSRQGHQRRKIIGRGKRKVKNRVAVALRTAATTLLKSDSYLGARYRSLRRQLPSFAAAVKAMGRYLAVLIYRVLTRGEAWVDRGATRFERRRTEQELASLNFKARAKGFTLVPITEPS